MWQLMSRATLPGSAQTGLPKQGGVMRSRATLLFQSFRSDLQRLFMGAPDPATRDVARAELDENPLLQYRILPPTARSEGLRVQTPR
jgi:hypothetical protein